MNRDDVRTVLAVVTLTWPHSNLGGDTSRIIDTWHAYLGGTERHLVEDAVKELAATGREHAPTVGVVLATIAARTADAPDWDEAWAEIEHLKCRYNPGFPGRETPPVERFTHPLTAAFAVPAWNELCLGPAPGTKNYGTFYAQQREAWKALAHRATRATALAAVGAPRRRSELARPDYLAALPPARGGQS